MQEYEGAVLYVDILGIAELTSGNSIETLASDFEAINARSDLSISNQTFCALLLSIFRKHLASVKREEVNVSQLSDCAFVWSKSPNLLLDAARSLMWKNLRSGVLCRAGMAYGQIIEPDKTNRSIGRFVCGDAVTRAAHLGKDREGGEDVR